MENIGLGAGLGALAFWLFVAAAVVSGVWDSIRKRETEHETLRRAIESGKELDEEMINRLMAMGSGSNRPDRDFKITALWILPISPGLVVLAYALRQISEDAFFPIVGAAGLLLCLAAGFWVAGMIASRWHQEDEQPISGQQR